MILLLNYIKIINIGHYINGDVMKNMNEIIDKIKTDTNDNSYITYRYKKIGKNKLCIIYNEPLVDSDKISDFIFRSLDSLKLDNSKKKLFDAIQNQIDNFKINELKTYKDLIYYLNSGFTIILMDGVNPLAFETKKDLTRSISSPQTENSYRGPMDCFVENIDVNIGLIERRIKSPDLWIKDYSIGKYTETKISLIYINSIAKPELVNLVSDKLKKINIDGVINSGDIKNLIEKENKSVFPTILSTERPDMVCQSLLKGKVVIAIDNSPFLLIIPGLFADFFVTTDDEFNKSLNTSFSRVIKYIAFFISLLTPALYIAITTYNQEILPTLLMINLSSQREIVPFPAFFEALIMIISFEILRESDLRSPSFSSSALSIVGALILGEAAVNAGLVSPIMIIVVSLTAISALGFTEPELINGLRFYRLLFMLSASFMGILGIILTLIYFIVKQSSLKSFGKPYLMPFVPTYFEGLKNALIKFPKLKNRKRTKYLSNNLTKIGDNND